MHPAAPWLPDPYVLVSHACGLQRDSTSCWSKPKIDNMRTGTAAFSRLNHVSTAASGSCGMLPTYKSIPALHPACKEISRSVFSLSSLRWKMEWWGSLMMPAARSGKVSYIESRVQYGEKLISPLTRKTVLGLGLRHRCVGCWRTFGVEGDALGLDCPPSTSSDHAPTWRQGRRDKPNGPKKHCIYYINIHL